MSVRRAAPAPMLGSLFLEKTADAVVAALDAGDAGGPVAVIDLVRLGRLLAGRGRAVVQVAARPRSLRRAEGARVHAAATALPIAEGSLGALVVSGVGDVDDWEQRMAGWIQAVRDGGLLVFVDRGPAAELSRRALCGGLARVQQRPAGRSLITSGVVYRPRGPDLEPPAGPAS